MHGKIDQSQKKLWQIRMAGKAESKTASTSVKADKTFSLKDRLFNAITVETLCVGLQRADPDFPASQFAKEVLDQFPGLELKACIECMATALVAYLPADYSKACAVLAAALPAPLDPTLKDNDFGEFIWSVPSEYAAREGVSVERLELSLDLLRATTARFSAEFAIRPFLKEFPDQTYAFLSRCARDDNYHVRRLASEGIRPFLPWGLRIDLAPERVIEMLDVLHADGTRFVTRSVANNLNDLSKNHPQLVLDALKRWRKGKRQTADELDWMTRHALRGLVKADHADALALLGYPTKPAFKIAAASCANSVKVGDELVWSARLTSGAAQKLKVMLRVYYLKSNGQHALKVFALKDWTANKGEVVELKKRLPFKAMTTRALYPGAHHIEVVVNGVARGKRSFVLNP